MEDFHVGQKFATGSVTVTEEAIIAFARQYDPQDFHTDPVKAKESVFGGLVASGWHTVCVGHNKMVKALFAEEDRQRSLGREPGVSGPSPGVNALEFKVPVRPGDTATFELVITDKRPSNSIPGWGLLFTRLSAVNQHGELVYRADNVGFSKLRDYRMPIGLRLLLVMSKLPFIGKRLKRDT